MSLNSPNTPRNEREARLTALLLGELSAEETAEVRRDLATDPALAELHAHLARTISLVREATASRLEETSPAPTPLKLAEARRQQLLQAFRTVTPEEWTAPRGGKMPWLIPWSIAAMLVGLIGAVALLPELQQREGRAVLASLPRNSGEQESPRTPSDAHITTSSSASPSKPANEPSPVNRLTRGRSVTKGYSEQRGSAAVIAEDSAHLNWGYQAERVATDPAQFGRSQLGSGGGRGRSFAGFKAGDLNNQQKPSDLFASFGEAAAMAGSVELRRAGEATVVAKDKVPTLGDTPLLGTLFLHSNTADVNNAADATGPASGVLDVGQSYDRLATLDPEEQLGVPAQRKAEGELQLSLDSRDRSKTGIKADKSQYNISPAELTIPSPTLPKGAALYDMLDVGQGHLPQLHERELKQVESLAKRISPAPEKAAPAAGESRRIELSVASTKVTTTDGAEPPMGRGDDARRLQDDADSAQPARLAPAPEPEVQTIENLFSTFSLNVSDVSFRLAAASLEKGVMPEPTTVRSEEFINAFNYRDPEPPPGAPITLAWERARDPFAHNRDLLRLSVKTAAQGRQAGRPLNLVLLLDNSGSMERADRVHIVREALRVLAGQLRAQDKFSVITFARTPRLWVDGTPGNQAAQAVEQLDGLTPEGGTNLEAALLLAYQTAVKHLAQAGGNRVVLLTDGAANLGTVDPDALKELVEVHRKQGVALDCFGIGWEGFNDDLLERLSRNGDGRYGFLNAPEEAANSFAAQLAGALQVAASDVKVQVEFNPNRVQVYRQIGYSKHQLAQEQFRDNTVDAAEIGAAESGTALYAVQVTPRGEGHLAVVRVRYKTTGTQEYEEQEWSIPYTGNAPDLEQASPALRLAATASAFSEWLLSSPYAADVTPDRLLTYLGDVPQTYGADPRPKQLEWMIRQAKSLMGK